jgi:hypothetical protein
MPDHPALMFSTEIFRQKVTVIGPRASIPLREVSPWAVIAGAGTVVVIRTGGGHRAV